MLVPPNLQHSWHVLGHVDEAEAHDPVTHGQTLGDPQGLLLAQIKVETVLEDVLEVKKSAGNKTTAFERYRSISCCFYKPVTSGMMYGAFNLIQFICEDLRIQDQLSLVYVP